MSAAGRFPTHEADDRLRAAKEAGVEIVPLHGTPAPPLPAHVGQAVLAALSTAGPAPHPRGLPELRHRLATVVVRTGRAVDADRELVVTNGAMHALGVTFRALLEPGDEVIVPAPCFFFEGPIRSAGGLPLYIRGSAENGWRWDPEAIESAIGPATRVLLLCNPSNPTGMVPTADEVAAVAAVAERHGLVIVTDEAYEASLWEGATLASAFPLLERSILIRSLGKSLSLPHLRLGLVAGPSELVERVALELEWDVLRVGIAAQAAAIAVLDGPRDWLDSVHATLEADRLVALEVAAGAGLEVVPPRSAPFLFCTNHRDGLADALVDAGIAAVDGRHFQAPGWARVPFGGAAANRPALDRALARFLAA